MRIQKIGYIFLILFTLGTMFILRDQLLSRFILFKEYTQIHEIQPLSDSVSSENNMTAQTPGALTVPKKITKTLFKNKPSQSISLDAFSSEILQKTNEKRKEVGSPILTEDAVLSKMAQSKANDMATKKYFAHISPKGDSVQNLAQKNNYSYIMIGENLAQGDSTESSTDIMNAWMNSPGHKANILNKKYMSIGIGTVKTTMNGENVILVVQHFATPRSVCPEIEFSIKASIDKKSIEAESIRTTINNIAKNTHEIGDIKNQTTYKELVTAYNNMISETKDLVSKYNTQVQNFNICIKNF